MTIRPAELEDLAACLRLDHSYYTEYVWQMDVHEDASGIGVNFVTVRLPRPVWVQYPRDQEALLAAWHRHDCFLVATAGEHGQGADPSSIVGYLTMGAYDWHKTGWVADLVVRAQNRRQGLGTRLLQAGKEWAHKAGLRRLTVEVQTKNHPALCFLERNGFTFCGYNDRYYGNQDIALFFSLDLR
jgi:ribosomal protein S18 acetylase RimI-like enzyme